LSEQFETAIDWVKRACAVTASQMRCPHHFRNPRLEIEIGMHNILNIEIFTCCEEFETQVREELRDNLSGVREELLYEVEGSAKLGLTRGALVSSHRSNPKVG
jgi:hypothetical protein